MISENTVLFQNISSEEYDDLSACGCLRSALYEKTPLFLKIRKKQKKLLFCFGGRFTSRAMICGETGYCCTVSLREKHSRKPMHFAMPS